MQNDVEWTSFGLHSYKHIFAFINKYMLIRGVTEPNRAELSKAQVRLVNFWKGSDSARVHLFSKIQARARVRLELIKIELGSGSFV